MPMMPNSTASSGVATLKWLVTPRAACRSMMPTSSTSTTAVTQPTTFVSRPAIGQIGEDPGER